MKYATSLTDVGFLVQGNCDRLFFYLLIYVPGSLLLCLLSVKCYLRGFRGHQKDAYLGGF